MSGSRTPEEIADLFPSYPYDRHRPIVDQGAVVDGVFEQDATSSSTRKPSRPPVGPDARRALEQVRQVLRSTPGDARQGRRHRLQRLGRRRRPLHDRQAASWPTTRTCPRPCRASGTRWACTARRCRPTCPFDVSGFTFSGLPGVVIGHNQQIAWGFTNLGPDVVDLYLEQVAGQDLPVRRQAPAAHDARRGDQGPRPVEAVPVHGPVDRARSAAVRRVEPAQHGRRERARRRGPARQRQRLRRLDRAGPR